MDQQDPSQRRPAVAASLAIRIAEIGATQGWEVAAQLIATEWDRLAVEAPRELLDGVMALPGQSFLKNPGLLVGANYLQRLVIDGDPGRFTADPRLDALMDPGSVESAEARLILLTGRIARARTDGVPDTALPDINAAREVLRTASAGERAGMAAALPNLRMQWGRTLDAADQSGAIEEYEQAYELAQLTKQPFVARRAAAHLAWHHTDQGRLNVADSWLARARSFREPNPRYDTVLYLAAAMLRLDRDDPAGADIELIRLTVVPLGESWAAALWVHAVHARTAAAAARVEARLAEELSRHSPAEHESSANSRYLRAARMRIAALRPGTHPGAPTATSTPHEHFTAAVRALRTKQHQRALQHSIKARNHDPSPRTQAGALLVAAAAQRALGRREHAAETMRQARSIIDTERLHTAYTLIPASDLRHLLSQAEESRQPNGGEADAPSFSTLDGLTARQRVVLALLTTDRPLADVAAELHISPNTLKTSLRRIYATLGVNSREAAATVARRDWAPR